MLKKIPAFLLLLILSSVPLHPSPGQTKDLCLDLKAVDNPAIAYKNRGNRCEGFYQSPVSAGSLDLVGLMLGKLDYDLKKDTPLQIFSPQVRGQQVHVQAVGIPMKTYYRLDVLLQPEKSFAWPLDIVQKMSLRPENIGLYGQLANEPEIYVPLAIKDNTTGDQLILTLRTSVDVGAIQWRQGTMTGQQCGAMSKSAWQTVKPGWGDRFYSGEPITINLPQQSTDFCIEFAARTAGSGSWLKRLVKVRMKE